MLNDITKLTTKLTIKSNNLKKEIRDLHVLIDTLQTNLRAVLCCLSDEQKTKVQTPSLKWCLNWKPHK